MADRDRPAGAPQADSASEQAGAAVVESSTARVEDARLLRGRGAFSDDVAIRGALHAAFIRSPHAHALIGDIDTADAARAPGVLAVFTGADLVGAGVGPIPTGWHLPGMEPGERRAIATGRVRYEGEAVAMIIADSPALARDAADRVTVDYDPLPFVTDASAAIAPGAPTVYDDVHGNVCFEWATGDEQATRDALLNAHTVARRRMRNDRLVPCPMEPRACAARWDAGELTLYVSSENPYLHRMVIGETVGVPEHRVRVVARDVATGYGARLAVYPEEVAVCWAARHLDRPVRWTATREECFLTDSHGHDHVTEAEMAFDAAGRITGLRVHTIANVGANLSILGAAVPAPLDGLDRVGPYAVAATHCTITGVFSHTSPVDCGRAAGRTESVLVVERLLDLGARALGLDPTHVRRQNMAGAVASGRTGRAYAIDDTINYTVSLDRALAAADYDRLKDAQREMRRNGRYTGVGVACYAAPSRAADARSGMDGGSRAALWDSAQVRVHATGRVSVHTGQPGPGRGYETTYCQVAAAALGVALEDVAVVRGDTVGGPSGRGAAGPVDGWAGASAVWLAARRVGTKATALAALLLGVSPTEVERSGDGWVIRARPRERCSFRDVAAAAHGSAAERAGAEPGLESTAWFDPPVGAGSFGTHVAVVEVDPETGVIELQRYVSVDDCGRVINPAIVEGQLHGAMAQGIGQALWEGARYDGSGRLVTRSLATYGIPRAPSLPAAFETTRLVTPSSSSPLGVRGVADAGAMVSPAAVANAVMDALVPFGVDYLDLPLTAEKVWLAIRRHRSNGVVGGASGGPSPGGGH